MYEVPRSPLEIIYGLVFLIGGEGEKRGAMNKFGILRSFEFFFQVFLGGGL